MVNELKELNLGSVELARSIYVSTMLTPKEDKEYFKLLSEYRDVFVWSYEEMPRLSTKVAVFHLQVKKDVSSKTHPQLRFLPQLIPDVKKKVNKLIDVGFICEVKYQTWISNIIAVRKKNSQLRICADFQDLNVACPKDYFPLPVTNS